jgi:MFS family permease
VLIGLYLLPGVVIALPGGALGKALGDKRAVLVGCSIMFVGNVIMAYSDLWSAQIAGRLLTGVGGVVVNVITSKMVVDWFAEREISTAMALFLIVALRHRGRAVGFAAGWRG